jgi:hypothetical protein
MFKLVGIFNVDYKVSFIRLCIVSFISMCIVIYTTININPDVIKCDDSHKIPCYRTPEHLRRLVQYAEDVTRLMNKLNMTSFLIYGSLWGVYRFHGPLPWDHDIDLGVIGDENFYNKKDKLVEELVQLGFSVRDDWSTASYKVLRANQTGHLGIFIFINYFGTMKRPGISLSHGYSRYIIQSTIVSQRGWSIHHCPRPTSQDIQLGYLEVVEKS